MSGLYDESALQGYGERTLAPRPDPSRGVFETLLVVGGELVELEAHMARLASSTSELFGAEIPPAARGLLEEHARGVELGRIRLDLALATGGRLTPAVRVADVEPALVFPSWERAVTLEGVVVPGGLGAHKWSDRRLLDQAQSDLGQALPLLLDDGGDVLEVARGNLFLVRDGALVTPMTDGRFLPGVARRRILEVAAAEGIAVHERTVSGDELAEADEVFASGSVRGVEPVQAYADVRSWDEGAVTQVISTRLSYIWLGGQDPV